MSSESKFIHLHTHSHFSLLDGLSKVDPLLDRCIEYKMPAVAITDHGNMYGAIEFYAAAKKKGVKPIIGVEAYISAGSRHDKTPGPDNKRYHLTLLAKNNTGYRNLMHLVTRANLEGFYYKPRMDKELLREFSEGIICLSGCFGGELSRALHSSDTKHAEKIVDEHIDIFGKENYFIEIMHHPGVDGLMETRKKLIELARRRDVPLVATQDSHYLDKDDARAQDVLVAVATGTDVNNEARFTMTSDDYSFIDTETAFEYFKDAPEAVENTQKVADMCDIEIELGTWYFPNFEIPKGTDYDGELRRTAYEGLKKRGMKETPDICKRLDYELDVIKNKGYSPYFLIVYDLIQHARDEKIFTTIRGSVAGSMTTYALGITNVDPFEYKLPFERFLNPERPSAPDIDMDFADNRRDEVLNYAREKYGEDHVAQIGTFGKMLAKGAVRDVARALGYPYSTGDRIANLIPMGSQGFPMTIERALEEEPDLKKLYEKDPDTKDILDMAQKVEGCARHISVHAAGTVIGPTAVDDFVPVQLDPKGGKIITQYDGHWIEDCGLIKFDFLGIRNLAILEDAVRRVKKWRNIDVDIEDIPVDDKKTFEMLARGETAGLFQLNGSGMTAYLKELRPTTIHDINAMVALYRPGPMEMIPEYIKRKYNHHLVSYLDPRLKDILAQSFGVITYQDDVMLIAIELAGYSWLEADMLRKAMGKKIPEVMMEQKEKLLKGFVEHGLSEEKAQKLWHLIEPFASYGFNKAHAASYGRVAYQTAYMKANYPAEYMAAVLTAESGDTEKIAEIITECVRMKIAVLPPNVNESFEDFTVIKAHEGEANDNIRFGLQTIKNLGNSVAEAIIEERKKNGEFTTYAEFLERVQHKDLNKRSLDALIKTGALDAFGERGQMLGNLDSALEYSRGVAAEKVSEQTSLFAGLSSDSLPTFTLKPTDPAPKQDMLIWEKELLGLYVSGHPLDAFHEKLKGRPTIKGQIARLREGMKTIIPGVIEDVRTVITKKGDKMAFVRIGDKSGSIDTVFFPKLYAGERERIIPEQLVVIKGKFNKRKDEPSIIVDAMKVLKHDEDSDQTV